MKSGRKLQMKKYVFLIHDKKNIKYWNAMLIKSHSETSIMWTVELQCIWIRLYGFLCPFVDLLCKGRFSIKCVVLLNVVMRCGWLIVCILCRCYKILIFLRIMIKFVHLNVISKVFSSYLISHFWTRKANYFEEQLIQ